MKKIAHLLFLILFFGIIVPHSVQSGPGDTIAEAKIAVLGENPGNFTAYNDIHWYNFTANPSITYNFSLYNSFGDYISIYVYDKDQNLLGKNFTLTPTRTLLISGEDKYVIGLYSSEFVNAFPSAYNFIISEQGSNKQNIEGSSTVDEGCTYNTFTLYNEVHWYNFSANASIAYKFSISRNTSAYIGLHLYDRDLGFLASNWTTGPINEILNSGESFYIIGVYSSEFIEFPLNYCLDIQPTEQKREPVITSRELTCFTGTLELYNSIDEYNFSGSIYRTYKFSLSRNISAYVGLFIYDSGMNLLASNWTIDTETSIILDGYADYIIKVVSSEFVPLPLDYTLCIEELLTGSPRRSLGLAEMIGVGNYTDTFTTYNDVHWYNFTANASINYEFQLIRDVSSFMTLTLYDNEMNILATTGSTGPVDILSQSGYVNYIIAVSSSEFIEFPQDYTLSIIDTTTSSNTSSGDLSSESTNENADTSSGIFDLNFPLFYIIGLFSIGFYARSKKKSFLVK